MLVQVLRVSVEVLPIPERSGRSLEVVTSTQNKLMRSKMIRHQPTEVRGSEGTLKVKCYV
jgi:hypothetical protein